MANKDNQSGEADSKGKSKKTETAGKSEKMPSTHSAKIPGTVGATASVGNIEDDAEDNKKKTDAAKRKNRG